jgi:transposase
LRITQKSPERLQVWFWDESGFSLISILNELERREIVDRWYPSSKTCCQCGHIQPMPLAERVFSCGECGQIIDRDLNASLNLERAPDFLVRSA